MAIICMATRGKNNGTIGIDCRLDNDHQQSNIFLNVIFCGKIIVLYLNSKLMEKWSLYEEDFNRN
jgi:hypothetical protein